MKTWRDIAEQARRETKAPDVLAERCVYSLLETASCRACADACPRHAWVLDDETLGIDTEICDGCGLCVPACPQDAIGQRHAVAVKQWKERKVAFCACEKTELKPGAGVVPCLHGFGLRDLLDWYRNGIRCLLFASADCEQCPRGQGGRLQQIADKLNRSLAHDACQTLSLRRLTAASWDLAMEGTQCDSGPQLSRRGFLRKIAHAGLQEGMQQAGVAEQGRAGMVAPGRLLPQTTEDTYWPFVPSIREDRCNGCDACIRLCPHQALVFEDSGGQMHFGLYPQDCTGCGICVDVCEAGAIRVRQWTSQGQSQVILRSGRCAACGAPFHEPEARQTLDTRLCRICSGRNHYQNLFQVLE